MTDKSNIPSINSKRMTTSLSTMHLKGSILLEAEGRSCLRPSLTSTSSVNDDDRIRSLFSCFNTKVLQDDDQKDDPQEKGCQVLHAVHFLVVVEVVVEVIA